MIRDHWILRLISYKPRLLGLWRNLFASELCTERATQQQDLHQNAEGKYFPVKTGQMRLIRSLLYGLWFLPSSLLIFVRVKSDFVLHFFFSSFCPFYCLKSSRKRFNNIISSLVSLANSVIFPPKLTDLYRKLTARPGSQSACVILCTRT